MQGGRFDHADRLFFSLPTAWQQVLTSTSDVKELVPELFYQPACLRNQEGLKLGSRQAGGSVGDVELPPWARGSADEFVRIHRCLLFPSGIKCIERIHASALHINQCVRDTCSSGRWQHASAMPLASLGYESTLDTHKDSGDMQGSVGV